MIHSVRFIDKRLLNQACVLAISIVCGVGCNHSDPKALRPGLNESIEQALADYATEDDVEREQQAALTMKTLGNEALPVLERMLYKPMRSHLHVLRAVMDVGTPEALRLLVTCLAEKKNKGSWGGTGACIALFMVKHNWTSAEMCEFPELSSTVNSRLKALGGDKDSAQAFFILLLAQHLKCPSLADNIKPFLASSDEANRKAAEKALREIQGRGKGEVEKGLKTGTG